MAWENRHDARRYFYRSRKVNGKVVHDYFGNGVVGQLAERLAARHREERKRLLDAIRTEKARLRALDRLVTLFARQMKRELRLVERDNDGKERTLKMWKMDSPTQDDSARKFNAQLRELVQLAVEGDESALNQIGKLLDGHPWCQSAAGELARLIQKAWLLRIDEQVSREQGEAVRKAIGVLRRRLNGSNPSKRVRMATDHAVLRCLPASYYAMMAASCPEIAKDGSLEERRIDAKNRFVAAVRMATEMAAGVFEINMLRSIAEGSGRRRY